MPDAVALNKGTATAVAIAGSANVDEDLSICGNTTLIVEVDMTAAAAGDVAVSVQPYQGDGLTALPVSLPTVSAPSNVFATGHAYAYAVYDVTALDKVRLRITNTTGTAQTLTRKSWRLA